MSVRSFAASGDGHSSHNFGYLQFDKHEADLSFHCQQVFSLTRILLTSLILLVKPASFPSLISLQSGARQTSTELGTMGFSIRY